MKKDEVISILATSARPREPKNRTRYDEAVKMAIEALRQPEPKWIPCSERLPEEGERVLATHLGGLNPSRQVIEHIYLNGKFTCGWDMDDDVHSHTFGQRFMGEVVAWMPLPEPYRGEQE